MSEKEKITLMCFIRNSIALICFTILAIIFRKWWIIFFALIFWCYVEKEED